MVTFDIPSKVTNLTQQANKKNKKKINYEMSKIKSN